MIGAADHGQTTKVHLLADVLGRPAVVHLTPDNASDVRTAPEVLATVPGRLKRLIAARDYDANHLRFDLKAAGTTPIIPGTDSRKRPIRHDKRRHRDRWRIEATSCRLKDFRRIATRVACPPAGAAGPGGQARRHHLPVLIGFGP